MVLIHGLQNSILNGVLRFGSNNLPEINPKSGPSMLNCHPVCRRRRREEGEGEFSDKTGKKVSRKNTLRLSRRQSSSSVVFGREGERGREREERERERDGERKREQRPHGT